MAFNKSLAGYFDDLQHIGIPTDDLQKRLPFGKSSGLRCWAILILTTKAMRLSLCNTLT